MRHLAVMGTSRSGTTALVQLMNGSPYLAVGVERYKNILATKPRPEIVRRLFEPDRFLDFRDGDTNIVPGPGRRFEELYEEMGRKLLAGTPRWIGDKMSPSRGYLDTLTAAFPDLHVVMILRDVLDVAASYVRRAQNPKDKNWPADRTHIAAVVDWTAGLRFATTVAERSPDLVHVARYEWLLQGDKTSLDALASFLDIPLDPAWLATYDSILARGNEVGGKELPLNDADIEEMCKRRDVVLEYEVFELAAAHRLRSDTPAHA